MLRELKISENWRRPFRYLVLSGLVLALAVVVWNVRDLIGPLVIAALLAYVLNPAADFLTRRTRLPRPAAVVTVYFTSLGILAALPIVLWPTLLAESQTLTVDLRGIISQVQDFLSRPVVVLGAKLHLDRLLPDVMQLSPASVPSVTESAFRLLETVTKNVIWLLVILITTFYLLQDWPRLREWLIRLAPEAYRPDVRRIYQEIKEVWWSYLLGNLTLMLVVGVVFSAAWVAIGLPGALILGILMGVLTIIPDLGPAIAAALAVLVALFEGSTYLPLSNLWFALLVTGIYMVLINLKAIWLRPRFLGRSVHMHEGVVFVAIMAAVVFQGILGALIIVPVMASAAIVGRYLGRRIYGLPPFPDPDSIASERVREDRQDQTATHETPRRTRRWSR